MFEGSVKRFSNFGEGFLHEARPRDKPVFSGKESIEHLKEQLSDIQRRLSDILEIKEPFLQSARNPDPRSRFWTAYEGIAQKDDDDVLDRYNGTLDVLLIFAGLFSGVSSSFIANNESNLQPNPTDTTNAFLQLLVQAAYNQTSNVTTIIPTASGPNSNVIWTQGLAYASLSLSLLTAFVAVLGKQWLGHYKNTRFGHGPQEERCIRRQLKLLAIDRSYLYFILDCLPFLLQLSLLSFGISIAGSIYVEERALGGIIIGMLSSGIVFYQSTALIGFLFNDSPYQTGITTGLRRFCSRLFINLQRRSHNYTTTLKLKYRQHFHQEVYPSGFLHSDSSLNTEEKGLQEIIQDSQTYTKTLELFAKVNMTNEESRGHWAVKWVLETSTDPEVIDIAVDMIPEVVWPANIDRTRILRRLQLHYAERTRHIYALSTTLVSKARACDRAIMHLLWTGHTTRQDYVRNKSSMDAPPMIWLSSDPNFRASPECICARLYYDERYRRRIRPIRDPDWLSYMMPYIILLRGRDQVVITNSVPIWYNILVSKANSRTSTVNVLAGIASALNLPMVINTLVLHDKSDVQDAMLIELMHHFRRSIRLESITRLADIPITWYLLEPFSLALHSLPSNIYFDAYPGLEDSALWALKIAFDAILHNESSNDQIGPVLNVRRIYEGALRLCGCIVRQAGTASAIEDFHEKVSKLELTPDSGHEVQKKLFDILTEADGEEKLDLAADALLVLGIIGGPFLLPSSVFDRCVATIDACLRKSWYHRSTALYAVWAARRHLRNSRIVQLGSRLLPSFIHITPSIQNLTDLNLSLMLSRNAIKDTAREFSVSERNAFSKLALGIQDLRFFFQGSSEEKLANFGRLPIQFIDLCMLIDGRRGKGSRKSFAPIIPVEVLADICIRGWKWFDPHGYGLLLGHGPKFWNTKTDSIIMTWIYTQLYFDFPAIMSSFVFWTSNTLASLIGSQEHSESVHRIFSGDVLGIIHVVTENIIALILEDTSQSSDDSDHRHIKNRNSCSTPTITILDCVIESFGREGFEALTSVREKELRNLLGEARNLEKILTEYNNNLKTNRKSRDSSEHPQPSI